MTDRAAIRQRYLALDTSTICDVFDTRGLAEPALDSSIQRITTPRAKAAGWACTIEGAFTVGTGPDRLKLKIADSLPEDSVAVWGGTNARGICLFGDLISLTMFRRGCRGAIVDGGVRDVDAISALDFPVFARYRSPVQSIGRWRVVRHDLPISLPGALGRLVTVSPGDFVLADSDGVVVIPGDRVVEILEAAEEVVHKETEARKLGAKGLSAQEMLDRYGHV